MPLITSLSEMSSLGTSVSRGRGTPGRHFTEQPQAAKRDVGELSEPGAVAVPHYVLPGAWHTERGLYQPSSIPALRKPPCSAKSTLHLADALLCSSSLGMTERTVFPVSLHGRFFSSSIRPYFYTCGTKGRYSFAERRVLF